ncbi:MAG: hypothetical protein DRP08_07800 [Candidatus Aenigmatarchaeota archaeon]|nr:MAG: hypothetical protein DRP08_07800 [Candidatus Aenigmarchaeota archaeon]
MKNSQKHFNPFKNVYKLRQTGIKVDPLKGIDTQKEYELIKEKKSNLPALQRALIKYQVEKIGHKNV